MVVSCHVMTSSDARVRQVSSLMLDIVYYRKAYSYWGIWLAEYLHACRVSVYLGQPEVVGAV